MAAGEDLCKRNALLMPEAQMQKLWLSSRAGSNEGCGEEETP